MGRDLTVRILSIVMAVEVVGFKVAAIVVAIGLVIDLIEMIADAKKEVE